MPIVTGRAVGDAACVTPLALVLLTCQVKVVLLMLMLTSVAVAYTSQLIVASSTQFLYGRFGKVILYERPVPPVFPTASFTSP